MFQFRLNIMGVLLLCSITFMSAQTAIQTAFSSQKETKHYKGRIDDINDITITLTYEGNKCHGSLNYLRSQDEFKLKGILKEGVLQLQEFNQHNKCTGYLKGKKEGTDLSLEWKNKDGSIGNQILVKEVNRKPDFPTSCGDNKWINTYNGKIKGEEVELILQRVDNNRILGQAFFKEKAQKMLVKGALLENDNLHLKFYDQNEIAEIASLKGVYKNKQGLNASFYTNQNQQYFVRFQLNKNVAINCLEYADYYTNYDFLFPKTKSSVFNELMILYTKDWLSECREQARRVRKQNLNVAARASHRAYSWTDIELLNDDFISGMLTYNATWGEGQKTKTFNYDLKANEIIELADIFKKGFKYKIFIKKYISKEIIKTAIYKNDSDFRNWIKDQDFSFFTLGSKGISFYTDFHIIYGRQRVMIPYKKMKGNIRKNSAVKKLY